MSTIIQNLLARFGLAPKREWAAINPDDIRAEMAQRRGEIASRQDRERADYNDRKPLSTADVADIQEWEAEGESLNSGHLAELEDFDRRSSSLASRVESLGGLYDAYVSSYAELEASTEEARQAVESKLVPLGERRAELELIKNQIKEAHSEIAERLREMGAENAISLHLDGWERAVLRAFYVEACQARRIDPDQGPVVPRMPELPKPLKPSTDRTVREKPFTIWDLPMLIGGLAFGSSAGAAVGGISFDSDGWHFSPIFWLLLSVATIAAFMVGKVLFHRLVAVRTIDSVDVYPYLTDAIAQIDRKKQGRSSFFAGAGLLGVFTVFCLTDFYGWWRAVTEQNAAYAGDAGSITLNPVFAGIAVAFITVLMAAVKLAAVTATANQRRNELIDEVRANTTTFADSRREHDVAMEEYNHLRVEASEYLNLVREAKANAEFRFRRDTRQLRQHIEGYLSMIEGNDPNEIMGIDNQMDEVVTRALAGLQSQREAAEAVGYQIDRIHSDLNHFRQNPQGGEGEDDFGFLGNMFPPREDNITDSASLEEER